MVDLLYCEFLKLKRSKMLSLSILGAMVTPIMMFAGVIKSKFNTPDKIVTYYDILSETNLYIILLFGLIVYTVIAAYLFSREYTENTLKTILTVPVSKTAFIISKLIMLLMWILALTMITWLCSLFFAFVSNASDFSAFILVKSIREFFLGAILVYLTISPFVFIAVWSKGIVAPIIAVTAVAMGNIALSNESLAALYPWSAAYLLITGRIDKTGYPLEVVIAIISITAAAGFMAIIIYFNKQDVK